MGDYLIDIGFVLILGCISLHGLTYKDANGHQPFVHLLFGCIALIYAMRVLLSDILHIW